MDFSDEEDYVPPSPSPKSNIDFTSTNIVGCDSRSVPRHVFFFEDVPWLGGHHDGYPISPTIDAYAEVRLNGRSRPDLPANERAALWQAALTFGILEAVMEVQIPERFLISFSKEEPSRLLLKDEHIGILFDDWRSRIQSFASTDNYSCRAWRERIDTALLDAYEQLMFLAMAASTPTRSEFAFHAAGLPAHAITRIVCAYSAISEAIIKGRLEFFGKEDAAAPGHMRGEGYSLSFIHAADACPAVEKVLIEEKGWCPFVVRSLDNSVVKLAYAARQDPMRRTVGPGHGACSNRECKGDNINQGTYSVQHTTTNCACSWIKPSLQDTLNVLAVDEVPVMVPVRDTLAVQRAHEVPYVAISHVWADGLGSTTGAGLPSCQVKRITALTEELLPGSAFWMDSLCVPSEREARVRAIGLMAKTYADATVVLVIDAGLRQCSSTAPIEERLLRVSSCGWLQRLWTLQEALLARRVVLQFFDAMVDLDELIDEARNTHDAQFNPLLASMIPLLSSLSLRRNHPDSYLSFGTIARALARRTTSRTSDETLAISGLLHGVDARTLAPMSSHERMRYVLQRIRILPRAVVFHHAPKIALPSFRWAPSTLLRSEVSEASRLSFPMAYDENELGIADGAAICTPWGLVAEWVVVGFPEQHISPEATWTIRGAEGGPLCAVAERPVVDASQTGYDCNALLFVKVHWPSRGEIASAAAVLMLEEDHMAIEPSTDGERVICEFQANVIVMGMGYSESSGEEVVIGETVFIGVRLL